MSIIYKMLFCLCSNERYIKIYFSYGLNDTNLKTILIFAFIFESKLVSILKNDPTFREYMISENDITISCRYNINYIIT